MDSASSFARLGLSSTDHSVISECYLEMQKEYQTALSGSLKLNLTAGQCSAFDQKSHVLECLRQELRKKLANDAK